MKSVLRTATAAAIAVLTGGIALPALAVLATDYTPPKVTHLGKTSVAIAGSGQVIVKVLVKSDGTFTVMNVLRSNNPADNAAALDIARHSSYRNALRGGKPATAFYDFTLKFSGKQYAGGDEQGAGGASDAQTGPIGAMLRSGNYAGAKTAASAFLAVHPGDVMAQSYLGLASALSGDDVSAAATFDQMSMIPSRYQSVAAQSFALAAVQLRVRNPVQALAYAKKAMALRADGNAYFALGVAELANSDAAGALPSLKKARDLANSDAKTTTKEKVAIDTELMQAYLTSNDQVNAQAMAAEIKVLDPTSTASVRTIAQADYTKADTLTKAHSYPEAIKQWEAGAQADPEPASAVTGWAQAALLMGQLDKPDYKAMSAEADKAIAAKPDDALANYAKGVALVNLGYQNKDDVSKKSGKDYLSKAQGQAKSANLSGLAEAIENFVKSIK